MVSSGGPADALIPRAVFTACGSFGTHIICILSRAYRVLGIVKRSKRHLKDSFTLKSLYMSGETNR